MHLVSRYFLIPLLIATSLIAKVQDAPSPPFELFRSMSDKIWVYNDIDDNSISYIDENGTDQEITINGLYWKYYIKLPEKEQPKEIERIIRSLENDGAKVIYRNKDKERILLSYSKENRKVFVNITYGWSDNFRIEIFEENYIEPSESVELDFDKDKKIPKKFLLRANFDGKHYYYLKVDILDGKGAKVTVRPYLEDTPVKIRYKTSLDCDSKYYKSYAFYDIDPYKATHDIYIEPLGDKTKVKLTLIKTPYKVDDLGEFSKKPGIFKLKNSISSLPTLKPLGYIFGDYPPKADYLPNKDAIYWLDNAYYYFTKDNLRTNLIPVLANHITTVTWPIYFEEMKKESQTENSDKPTTKLAVFDIKSDDNKTVQANISISHLGDDINLTKEDFKVFEDGINQGEVISLQRLYEPMHVVILLDSSGSMKKSMKLALNSVKAFINSLPEDAKITLVDFDTKVKPIKAKNKKELLKKLSKIRANGATALYDSLIKGTKLLKDKSRASIVLFTDGKDANYNDTKRGSKATFEEMIKTIQERKIPIYPIAFGKKADTTTLTTIAKMTKTTYYQGESKESLKKIFDDIAKTLSSAYQLTYKRPTTQKPGSQPVVNYMVDVSGSMDLRFTMATKCKGCGYRLEQLKEMLRESIEALPEDTFIQLSQFSDDVKTLQILTQDKAKLLTGIGALDIGGGTEIVKAVKKGLALSKLLPSNRRYFIFTTDAAGDAFAFDEKQKKELNSALLDFKKNGIQTFWLGMWKDKSVQKHMAYLAKLSGGESFVSSDIKEIRDKIVSITQKVNDDKDDKKFINSVVIKLKKRDEKSGQNIIAVGDKEIKLPIRLSHKLQNKITDITYTIKRFETDKKSYNPKTASLIYGDDIPIKETRVRKMIDLVDENNKTITGKNKAITMQIPKAYIFDRIKDIGASSSTEFLVLELNITNILPKQKVAVLDDGSKHPSSWIGKTNDDYTYVDAIPTYRIPNLKNHLFIRVNNTYEVPFHPLTWALEKPLTDIDEYELSIEGNASKHGVLLFEIPDKPITALSLHYYDTNYGHIDLPVIGELKHKKEDIQKLSKEPLKLSDAFELSFVSTTFTPQLLDAKTQKASIFEVVTLDLRSQVNALLALDPKKRFSLKIKTPNGDFFIPPHPITKDIPFGFYKEISLAPGSNNRIALVFQIPKKLQDYPQSLVVELKGKDKELAINDTQTKESEKEPVLEAEAENIKLSINDIYKNRDYILVDITLDDKEDGYATRLHNFLNLSYKDQLQTDKKPTATHKGLSNFGSVKSSNAIFIDSDTNSKLLGCDNMVLDGYKKRCVVLFDIDKIKKDKTTYLLSPIFKDLKYSFNIKDIKDITDKDRYLLCFKLKIEESDSTQLERLLAKIRKEKLLKGKNIKTPKKVISLDSPEELPKEIKPLPISLAGAKKLSRIKTLQDALNALKEIEWVPYANADAFYSVESMLTQGWGTELPMTQLLYKTLRTRNIEIKTGFYTLTQEGKEYLQTLAKGIKVEKDSVPFIEWIEDKKHHTLVVPFFRPADELKAYIDTNDPYYSRIDTNDARISITLYYTVKNETASMQVGGMAASLSGSTKTTEKDKEIFSENFDLNKYSNMPIDIWFGKGKNKKGDKVLKTFVYKAGEIDNKLLSIPSDIVPKKLVIKLYDGDEHKDPLVVRFKKGEHLQDLFFTFSFSSPDLPKEAADMLEDAKNRLFKHAQHIDPLSLLQWINRAKIYKFVSIQTAYEKALEKNLNVKARRHKTPRVIVAMVKKTPDKKIESSLDLRYVFNNVYGDEEAQKSFNLISGFLATYAEGASVPASETVLSLWKKDRELRLMTILPDNKEKALDYLKNQKIPKWIQDRLEDSDRVWLFPTKAIQNRYAWLEIDPKSHQTVSVLDNGQYSAMTETVITEENIETTTRYFLGLLIGTNISVGSVIDFSLKGYEDYRKLKEEAHKFAKILGCYVKKIESFASDAKGETKSALQDEVMENGIGDDTIGNTANRLFGCKDAGDDSGDDEEPPEEYSDLVNFGKGIDHSIAYYFEHMK